MTSVQRKPWLWTSMGVTLLTERSLQRAPGPQSQLVRTVLIASQLLGLEGAPGSSGRHSPKATWHRGSIDSEEVDGGLLHDSKTQNVLQNLSLGICLFFKIKIQGIWTFCFHLPDSWKPLLEQKSFPVPLICAQWFTKNSFLFLVFWNSALCN